MRDFARKSILPGTMLVACCAGLGLAASAAPAPKPSSSSPIVPPARAAVAKPVDARLKQIVRVEQVGGDLAAYLASLTKVSDVHLEAAEQFQSRSFLAINVDSSLQQLQQAIAATYQLTWQSTGEPREYLLGESKEDRRVRANARATNNLRVRRQLMARWQEVSRMASLPEAQLGLLARQGDRRAQSMLSSVGSATSRLYFGLHPAILQQFWQTGSAQLSIAQLPSELRALVAQAVGSQRATIHPEGGEPYEIKSDPNSGTLQLQFGGTPDRPTVWGRLRVGGGFGMDTNLLYAEGWTRQPASERRQAPLARRRKPVDDSRFKTRVSLTDLVKRTGVEVGERPEKGRPLAVLLQELGKQIDLPVLAECDYKPKDAEWLRKQWWLSAEIVKQPLSRALDLMCADFEYEWRFEEGAILLRPATWYLEPAEREYRYPRD